MATTKIRACAHCGNRVPEGKRYYCSVACQVWFKTDIKGPDECWLWTGYTQKGYGAIMAGGKNGKPQRTHRLAWEIHHGRKMADGMHACHVCDERLCNNPHHIFEGSPKDNTQDMMKKGRNKGHPNPPRGKNNPMAKLNDKIVADILKDTRSYGDIAKQYGVSNTVVRAIKIGETWTHVDGPRCAVVDEATTLALRRAKTSRLTENVVRGIRADTRKYELICREYGVCPSTVSNIKAGKIWKDII